MANKKPKNTANKKSKNQTTVTVKSEKAEEAEVVAEEVMDEEKVEEVAEETAEEVVEEVVSDESEEDESEEDSEEDSEDENQEETSDEDSEDEEEKDSDEETEETSSETTETICENEKKGFFKTMFAKKCDPSENILTIFSSKKIYGALIAEVFGTMVLALVFLTLGMYQPLYTFFVVLGVSGMAFGLSGANLNPAITVGMLASRRMSAIRGVLYILAQILGAWLAYLICTGFISSGAGATTALPQMTPVDGDNFLVFALIELLGTVILAFGFARALAMKKSGLGFSLVYAGSAVAAYIIVIVISSNFLALTNNFMMNPAVALMYQILPTGGDNLGDLLSDIGLALATFVAVPMVGGALGFFISDLADTFKGEDEECCCNK